MTKIVLQNADAFDLTKPLPHIFVMRPETVLRPEVSHFLTYDVAEDFTIRFVPACVKDDYSHYPDVEIDFVCAIDAGWCETEFRGSGHRPMSYMEMVAESLPGDDATIAAWIASRGRRMIMRRSDRSI